MLRFCAKRLKELHEIEGDERGFTLIELLVVIIIIGILAAIAIPVFFEQREKAWDAAVQSNLRNAAAAATSCSADNDVQYGLECDDEAELDAFGYNEDPNVNLDITLSDDTTWSADAFFDSDGDGTMEGDTDYTFTTDTGVVTEVV